MKKRILPFILMLVVLLALPLSAFATYTKPALEDDTTEGAIGLQTKLEETGGSLIYDSSFDGLEITRTSINLTVDTKNNIQTAGECFSSIGGQDYGDITYTKSDNTKTTDTPAATSNVYVKDGSVILKANDSSVSQELTDEEIADGYTAKTLGSDSNNNFVINLTNGKSGASFVISIDVTLKSKLTVAVPLQVAAYFGESRSTVQLLSIQADGKIKAGMQSTLTNATLSENIQTNITAHVRILKDANKTVIDIYQDGKLMNTDITFISSEQQNKLTDGKAENFKIEYVRLFHIGGSIQAKDANGTKLEPARQDLISYDSVRMYYSDVCYETVCGTGEHTYEYTSNGDLEHTYTCTNCKVTGTVEHTDENEDETCDVCKNPCHTKHTYDVEAETADALKTAGNCKTASEYYYSCKCGVTTKEKTFYGSKDLETHTKTDVTETYDGGETIVKHACCETVIEVKTKHGIIPGEYYDKTIYPWVIYKSTDGGKTYSFQGAYQLYTLNEDHLDATVSGRNSEKAFSVIKAIPEQVLNNPNNAAIIYLRTDYTNSTKNVPIKMQHPVYVPKVKTGVPNTSRLDGGLRLWDESKNAWATENEEVEIDGVVYYKYTHAYDTTYYNLGGGVGTATFELGEHELVLNGLAMLSLSNKSKSGDSLTFNINGGTINNVGYILFAISHSIAKGTAADSPAKRDIIINLNGTTINLISDVSIVSRTGDISTSDKTFLVVNSIVNLNNCTIDASAVAGTSLTLFKNTVAKTKDGEYIDGMGTMTVTFTGGTIKSNVSVQSTKLDPIEWEKLMFISVPGFGSIAAPTTVHLPEAPEAAETVRDVNGNLYGHIPAGEYASAEDYPFAVFVDGKFVIAFKYWSSDDKVNEEYVHLTKWLQDQGSYKDKIVNIYLRRDYTADRNDADGDGILDTGFNNLAISTIKEINYDFGTHTLDAQGISFVNLNLKRDEAAANVMTFRVQNGTLKTTATVVPIGATSTGNTGLHIYDLGMNVVFENVKFNTAAIIVSINKNIEDISTDNLREGLAEYPINVTFENCTMAKRFAAWDVSSYKNPLLVINVTCNHVANGKDFDCAFCAQDRGTPGFDKYSGSIGNDLALNFYVNNLENLDGFELVLAVNGGADIKATGANLFTFSGIGPHQLGDKYRIELYAVKTSGDEEIRVLCAAKDYSFEEYLHGLYAEEDNKANTELCGLIYSILKYAQAAESYTRGYTDITVPAGLSAAAYDANGATKTSPAGNTDALRIYSAGVQFDCQNRIFFKLYSESGNFTATINGVNVSASAVKDGEYYVIYTDAIAPDKYDDSYVLVVTDGVNTASVSYSVNIYAKSMSADDFIGTLANALYNYGKAYETYTAVGAQV